MRDKILMIILFFVLMAAIPLCFIANNATQNGMIDQKSEKPDPYISYVAELCDEDYCDEALKAMAIIAKTNSRLGGKLRSKTNNNSDLELYKRIKSLSSKENIIISIDNKQTEIPVSKCSNGNTVAPSESSGLTAVASPWDHFSPNFDPEAECVGVSADGIDYLCKNGMSAEDALRWYLPNSKIAFAK